MSQTPSKRRHEGREAYDKNSFPSDFCPYKSGWGYESKARDWYEGWAESAMMQRTTEIDKEKIVFPTCPFCKTVMFIKLEKFESISFMA